MMRSIFYAIYLTDVVGLDPRLGSFGALIGIAWDAINDPLIGLLSVRMRTRWERRTSHRAAAHAPSRCHCRCTRLRRTLVLSQP